jgi:hypothetical protein
MTVVTICRLYESYEDASRAVGDLEDAGLPAKDISMLSNNSERWYSARSGAAIEPGAWGNISRRDDVGQARAAKDRTGRLESAGVGAAIGATAGTGAGIFALLTIPGVGPVVGLGWLLPMLAGAAAGGVAGGIIGALTKAGVSSEDAQVHAEGLRRGGTLVTARVPETDASRTEAVMDRSAVNIRDRGAEYRNSGRHSFDPDAPPYTRDEVSRERELHMAE